MPLNITGNNGAKAGVNLNNFNISAIGKFDQEYKSILTNRCYLDLYNIENTVIKDEQALKNSTYNSKSYGEKFFLQNQLYGMTLLTYQNMKVLRFMVCKIRTGMCHDCRYNSISRWRE
jgi:hypothetical protein